MSDKSSWLEYPDNVPKRDGEYLISRNGKVSIAYFHTHFKFTDHTGNRIYTFGWENEELGGIYEDVDAFMEIPKAWSKDDG